MRPEYVQGYLDALEEMCVLKYDVESGYYRDANGNRFRVASVNLRVNDKAIPYEDIVGFNVSEGSLQVDHWEKRSCTN